MIWDVTCESGNPSNDTLQYILNTGEGEGLEGYNGLVNN